MTFIRKVCPFGYRRVNTYRGLFCERNMSKKCKLDSNITGSSKFTNHIEKLTNRNKSTESRAESKQFIYLRTPEKSPCDKKDYSVIRLENGLTALLITDHPVIDISDEILSSGETTDESGSETESENSYTSGSSAVDSESGEKKEVEEKIAACALSVSVGSFSDPPDIPGLAHFLEHMVFMGSEKYPTENEFDAFIKRKGGSDNASTECEYTTFYFECQEEHLYKGMDIFCQFFISPLMKFEAITRERQAIESEFQMALPSDSHRRDQLLCSMAHKDNPAHKFMWGNLITLRDNVTVDHLYDSVHKFRERHYSAHRMALAVQARVSQEKLSQWVVNCFSKVKNNKLPPVEYPILSEPFQKDLFSKIYYIEPVNDICEVELTWVLPSVIHLYKTKPLEYTSWQIGHEGKGSLLSYLKKKMWALGISAGEGDYSSSNSLYSTFSIKIVLTEEGYKHLDEVLEATFSYIKMLQLNGPEERLFKEIQSIYEMNFIYSDELPAIDNVESLVENMHLYPPEHYLSGPELYFEYNPKEIKYYLDLLHPNSVNVMVSAKAVKNEHNLEQTEKWFGTKYQSVDIPADWMSAWLNVKPNPAFHLPEPNIFITTDFSILPVDEDKAKMKYPRKIKSDDLIELWFKEDVKFNLPQAYVYFRFISPCHYLTPMHATLHDVYIGVLNQQLIEEAFPATMAEMSYQVSNNEKGLSMMFSGFNQKLPLLINKIVEGLLNFEKKLTPEMFEAMKKAQHRSYINANLKASNLATELRLSASLKVFWPIIDRLKMLPDVTLESLKEYSRQYLESTYIHALIQGNMTEQQALDISETVVNALKCKPLPPSQRPQTRVCKLEEGERFIRANAFNQKDSNCVTTMYYQYGPGKIRDSCIIEMLQMLLEEPLFDTLRTQEQLGYDVSCTLRDTYGILGFSITVVSQATKCTVEHVEERINNFLETSLENLKKMSKKDFDEVVTSVIKLKQCCDIHLKEEVRRNWAEIDDGYVFDRLDKEVEYLSKLKMDDVRSYLESQLRTNKRKMTVQVVGRGTENEDESNEVSESSVSNTNLNLISDIPGKPPELFITDTSSFKKHLTIYPVNFID